MMHFSHFSCIVLNRNHHRGLELGGVPTPVKHLSNLLLLVVLGQLFVIPIFLWFSNFHHENLSMQYTEIFFGCKL